MNYLDIIIAIVLFLFGFKGYRKGLIIEVVTLLAFGVGIYGAMHFSDFTAAHLQEVIEINPKYLNTIAFVLTFVLLVIVVNLIGRAVTNIIKAMTSGMHNMFILRKCLSHFRQKMPSVRRKIKSTWGRIQRYPRGFSCAVNPDDSHNKRKGAFRVCGLLLCG